MAIRVGHGLYQWHITFRGQRSGHEVTVNVNAANIEQALGMAHPPEVKPVGTRSGGIPIDPEFWDATRAIRGGQVSQPYPVSGGTPRY